MTEPTPLHPRRRYTKRQKTTTVIAAEMSTVAAAAEASGIPETTVRYWMEEPEFVELRAKTREDMADEASVLAHKVLEHIKGKLHEFEPRDLTILLGVLVDKSQLLNGAATSRTETRDLTGRLDEAQADRLMNDIDEWLASRAVDVDAGT